MHSFASVFISFSVQMFFFEILTLINGCYKYLIFQVSVSFFGFSISLMLFVFFFLCRKCKLSCWWYMLTSCLKRSNLAAMPCSEMKRYFAESCQFIFKKICALEIFKQIIYKLSIYFCIRWMISPGYIGSTTKYLEAWNLFLAYLNRLVGLFFKKSICYMIILTC